MKDVAKLANVSIQTVSVVVNNKPDIAPETRARVLSAIETLGYQPYTVARSLRTGATRTIALIVSDITNPFFASMANTVEYYAHEAGYSVILHNTHSDLDREQKYIELALQRGVDGMLFVATKDEMPGLDSLEAAGTRVVAIDRVPDNFNGPTLTLNNIKTGVLVAEHLLELGHTRLAHIGGPLDLHLSRDRMNGFHDTIRARGLEPGPVAFSDSSWSARSGYEAMQTLLDQDPLPTAVFAANDRVAIGAMGAITQAGLRIPEDISIVGVDDIEFSMYQTPPLTTVRQSLEDIATLGIKTLLDILEQREPERTHIAFEPMLIVRGSTGAPIDRTPYSEKGPPVPE
ncbi:MAG: LacI family DNA-binding transcriptional regulator [Anaerolineae bacterium]|nr:LacI family DNA-binding transcriptional regulator [Anaerolineae bacterium]